MNYEYPAPIYRLYQAQKLVALIVARAEEEIIHQKSTATGKTGKLFSIEDFFQPVTCGTVLYL